MAGVDEEFTAEPVKKCDECGGPIYEGDTIYEIAGYTFCEECIYEAQKRAI